jgi:universal stress protein E
MASTHRLRGSTHGTARACVTPSAANFRCKAAAMKLSNILVIIDPTAQQHPALERAAQLAQRCDARLELFACDTTESWNARYAAYLAASGRSGCIVNLRALLDPLAAPLRERGIDVSIETALGNPLHHMLLDHIRRCSPDLVVKDTHHHTLLRRTLFTHTDWHLIRGSKAPLLLAKSRPWQSAPVLAAAIDPGHVQDRPQALDHRILDCAHGLTRQLAGTLQVLHAFLPLELASPPDVGLGITAVQAAQAAEAQRRADLEKFLAAHELPASSLSMRLGVASQVLPDLAAQLNVDLLVMGAVSRSGLERIFIGSTAEQVLEALPCDVLVLKSPDFAAALPM